MVVFLHAGRVLAALVVAATIGGLLQNHVLALPRALAAPMTSYTRELHAWQVRDGAALACDVAQSNALTTESAPASDQAVALCQPPAR
jgi:hypothetical protein